MNQQEKSKRFPVQIILPNKNKQKNLVGFLPQNYRSKQEDNKKFSSNQIQVEEAQQEKGLFNLTIREKLEGKDYSGFFNDFRVKGQDDKAYFLLQNVEGKYQLQLLQGSSLMFEKIKETKKLTQDKNQIINQLKEHDRILIRGKKIKKAPLSKAAKALKKKNKQLQEQSSDSEQENQSDQSKQKKNKSKKKKLGSDNESQASQISGLSQVQKGQKGAKYTKNHQNSSDSSADD